jgi:hypothetical protein
VNRKQKNILITGITIIVAELVVWYLQGIEVFTQTQKLIDKTTSLDRMLGIENKQFIDKFAFGLLPSGFSSLKEFSSVATLSLVIIFIIVFLLYLFRNKKKETI